MGSSVDRTEPGSVDPGWADVALATQLFAVDPTGLGGILLRGRSGPQRDRVCAWIRELQPAQTPFARIPLHITEDRLLGGLSLAETLRSGHIVREQGVLARCDGGIAVVTMAERLESHVASHLCAVLDRGQLVLERESISAVVKCELGLVVLDEGIDDERAPDGLRDRLALALELDALDPRAAPVAAPSRTGLVDARARLDEVALDSEAIDVLCQTACALGIASLRAVVLAASVARVHAALAGRERVEQGDLEVAARLVLGPRATCVPTSASEEDEPEEDERDAPAEAEAEPADPSPDPEALAADAPEDPSPPPPSTSAEDRSDEDPSEPALDDIVLAAAKSGIQGGLLELLRGGATLRNAPRRAGQAGAAKASTSGGRPVGTISAMPSHGARLHVLDTLRAAAPWQRLRRGALEPGKPRRIEVRKEDFRVQRFAQRTETCVIFAVDASGSAAQQRLAEAKGAVERVLVDCYVRRDHVALISFRGTQATLVLPPTRSLARVRRRLADLAGGGATPLATGIDAALQLATESRKKGRSPLLVLMTDARGNVARDGQTGRAAATRDALDSSRRLRGSGIPTLMLDTATRSRPPARLLAAEMNARYVPLPHLDTAGVAREIQALAKEGA